MVVGVLYAAALVVATAFSVGLLVLGVRNRDRPAALPFVAAMAGITVMVLAALGTVLSPVDAGVHLAERALFVGIVTVVASIFLFTLEYTGRERYVTRWTVALLAVEPVAVVALVATNHRHHRIWSDADVVSAPVQHLDVTLEVGFWLHAAYSYTLLAAATAMLVAFVYRARHLYRGQAAAILLGVLAPWLGDAAYLAGLTPVSLSQIGFTVTGAAFYVATSRYRLIDVAPIARSTVVDQIEDGVFVVDERDRIVDVNPAGRDLLGGTDGSLVGERLETVLADSPAVYERLRDVSDAREELTVATDDGVRTFDLDVTPLAEDRGRRVGRLFVVHDITDRTRRERELERSNEQLDRFASLLSHDLRNPLGVAAGYVDLAAETCDAPELQGADAALDRMERLIEDALTLARQGRESLTLAAVPLERAAQQAWGNVETGDATLEVRDDTTLVADPGGLARVLENLFRNSVEHAAIHDRSTATAGPTDEPHVRAAADADADATDHDAAATDHDAAATDHDAAATDHDPAATDHDGESGGENEHGSPVAVWVGTLTTDGTITGFYVADDGRGIPPDDRDSALEAGFTTGDGGTGLGLAIVRTIADAHGWTVTVTESDRGGACLEFHGVNTTDN